MSGDGQQLVGSISLADLAALCDLQGHGHLPYPFAHGVQLAANDLYGAGTQPIVERFSLGDLRIFAAWMEALRSADIWVECRVHHRSGDLPDTRLLALRAGESGFLASQRTGQDVVDIYSLSAYDLGPAIARSVGLTGPGRRSQVVIPRCVNYFREADVDSDDYATSVRVPVAGSTIVRVRDADVAALATVQSHHTPARSWGVNWEEKFLVWVRVEDDGDYIYDAAFHHAEPMSERQLGDRIDGLIAEDVAAIRRDRGIG